MSASATRAPGPAPVWIETTGESPHTRASSVSPSSSRVTPEFHLAGAELLLPTPSATQDAAAAPGASLDASRTPNPALSDASSQDPVVSVSLNLAPATAAASPLHRAPLDPALTRRPAKSMEPLCLLLLLLPAPLPSCQGLASPPPDRRAAPPETASTIAALLASSASPLRDEDDPTPSPSSPLTGPRSIWSSHRPGRSRAGPAPFAR